MMMRPSSRYMLLGLSSPTRPNFRLMPYWVIIARASFVAFSISLAAPVVTVSNTISSAALPATNSTSMARISFSVFRYFSSSGTFITYPRAPMVLGTIVIFWTGSESFCRADTRAWPTSW